jgi:3-oxoacyl-[acyl-carrier protein] reductase
MTDLHGKCAVVTGSSRGIGAEIARVYAKAGARVVVSSRDLKACELVVKEIENLGGEAIAVQCDVSKEDEVKNLIDKAAENYGSVEILVNNAGVFGQKPIDQMDIELWKKIRSVDLDGVFFATKYAAEKMKKVKWGRIINISAVAGLGGLSGSTAYCAAKFAVIGITMAENFTKTVSKVLMKRAGTPQDIATAALYLASEDANYITGTSLVIDGGWTCHL